MNIREREEQWELENLSPYASYSSKSLGRDIEEEQCDIRTVYVRDRDRIIHSKAFRRLKHKTQVFLSPEGDHYRTRLTHTLEVSQIARTIARALRLNEDLTEAIALGHDLGHTPFGHTGENALNEVNPKGFRHNEQSVRVVERIERKGSGLNLTKEVRDGIFNHKTKGSPSTLEGQVVRLSDKIAYINHDIDDAIRGSILKESDLPAEYTSILGNSVQLRLDQLIHDVITQSLDRPCVTMSPEISQAMMKLRTFMFQRVYTNPIAKAEESKAKHMIQQLYLYYIEHTECLPEEFQEMIEKKNQSSSQVVCDYIAGMTDSYSVSKFQELFVPKSWKE